MHIPYAEHITCIVGEMMRYIITCLIALFLIFPGIFIPDVHAVDGGLLPESLAARSEVAVNKKTFTVFLKEDDPEKLTALLNSSNEDYAQKGWSVFTIIPYSDNGDVDGFFVTYSKGLEVE
jgi:hypothetical protein